MLHFLCLFKTVWVQFVFAWSLRAAKWIYSIVSGQIYAHQSRLVIIISSRWLVVVIKPFCCVNMQWGHVLRSAVHWSIIIIM